MDRKSILDMLKEQNLEEFKAFVISDQIAQVDDNEEVEFFKSAPAEWQEVYLDKMWPKPKSERCLMITCDKNLLKLTHDSWGFWGENLIWALQSRPVAQCRVILSCLTDNPGEEAEIAMLRRNDTDMLHIWLRKFKSLSNAGEQFMENSLELQTLKSEYINMMLSKN